MTEKHFLVVGGSRGIGRVLVQQLIEQGYQVSLFGRNPLADVSSNRLAGYQVDVSDKAALLSRLDQAVAHFGKLSCVVFLQRHRADNFEKELAVQLGATKNTIDYLVAQDYFVAAQSNSIVMVGSIADRYIAPEQTAGYHAGKAALAQLAHYYALTLGKLGIRVNTVSPCVVAKAEASEFWENNAWLVERFNRLIPLGRMGNPQDIVNAIMFLAGEQASYITGQNIVVDGGLTLRSHESLIRDFPLGA